MISNDPFGFGYNIDEFGKVTNLKADRKSTHTKTQPDKDGYLRVCLISKKSRKFISIHRLVAMIYCKGFSPELVVNHKDGNRLNNHWCNLEWITPLENERHARKVLGKRMFGEKASQSKLDNTQVLAISERLKSKESMSILATEFNVSRTTIFRIKNKLTYPYLWKEN